ncbi:IS91 family transposase [Saccharicrinis sp. 156]|uniref:IS91 family transposase n=1 Tax=Saccharicrinis sp. 156 TaxID=3417574 RepID=UPI003D33C6C4
MEVVPNAPYLRMGKYANYLYCVQKLSASFKAAFPDSLKRGLRKAGRYSGFYRQVQNAFPTNWVVYSEASMADSEHMVRYLGQYTHRIAIANDRIISISDTHVKFRAKDYRKKGPAKPQILEGTEFLRRFCQHVMPKGFVRVRRYGISLYQIVF